MAIPSDLSPRPARSGAAPLTGAAEPSSAAAAPESDSAPKLGGARAPAIEGAEIAAPPGQPSRYPRASRPEIDRDPPTAPLAWWGMPSVFDGLDAGGVFGREGDDEVAQQPVITGTTASPRFGPEESGLPADQASPKLSIDPSIFEAPETDNLDISGEFRRMRDDYVPRSPSEDLMRQADGVPHDVVGLTAMFSVMFAALAVVVFVSGGTVVRVVAVVLTVLGLPLLVSWLATRSERERDHIHPSR